jgi:hypothetical protein
VNINTKPESIIIPCQFSLFWRERRWNHSCKIDAWFRACNVTDNVSIYILVKCVLSLLQYIMKDIPLLAWKSLLNPVKTW